MPVGKNNTTELMPTAEQRGQYGALIISIRGNCRQTGTRPTHLEADDVITKFKDDLNKYAEGIRKVLNPVWEKEFEKDFVKKN